MKPGRQLFRDSALSLGGSGAALLLGFVTRIIVARNLGPDGLGKYVLIVLLPELGAALFGPGLPTSTVYYVGRARNRAADIIGTNLTVGTLSGLLTVALGAALFEVLFPWHETVGASAIYAPLVATIPLVHFTHVNAVFLGHRRFGIHNGLLLGRAATTMTLTVLMVRGRDGLSDALWAYSASWLGMSIVAELIAFRTVGRPRFSKAFLRESFRYSLTVNLVNGLRLLVYRLDFFLVERLVSPVGLGIYAAAVNVADKTLLVSDGLTNAILPRTASQKSTETTVAWRAALLTLGGLAVICTLAIALSGAIVVALLGSEFAAAAEPLRLLMPGYSLLAFGYVLGAGLFGRGRPRDVALVTIVALVVDVGLVLILAPRYGVAGAAIASSTSYAVAAVLFVVAFRRIRPRTDEPVDRHNTVSAT